jgi:hypothetical protein
MEEKTKRSKIAQLYVLKNFDAILNFWKKFLNELNVFEFKDGKMIDGREHFYDFMQGTCSGRSFISWLRLKRAAQL